MTAGCVLLWLLAGYAAARSNPWLPPTGQNYSVLTLLSAEVAMGGPCRNMAFEDVSHPVIGAAEPTVAVYFSPAFCPPFANPLLCLSSSEGACMPSPGVLMRAMVSKYDLRCAEALSNADCASQTMQRTDASLTASLSAALAANPQLAASIAVLWGGTAILTGHSGNRHAVDSLAAGLPVATYVGGPIVRSNTEIVGYPTDLNDVDPAFDTVPLFTNNEQTDCRGVTIAADRVGLVFVGSVAGIACGSAELSRYVRDYVIELDTISNVGLRRARIEFGVTPRPPHVAVHIAARQLGLASLTEPLAIDIELEEWTSTSDIALWATDIAGVTRLRITDKTGAAITGLMLASSNDPGPWPSGLFNASALLPSSETLSELAAGCPSSTLAHTLIVGTIGGAVMIVVGLLIAVVVSCCRGDHHETHQELQALADDVPLTPERRRTRTGNRPSPF